MSTADYYAGRIAQTAVSVDNSTVAELIADAAEDADVDLDWSEQGEVHEQITMRIEEATRQLARDELEAALGGQ